LSFDAEMPLFFDARDDGIVELHATLRHKNLKIDKWDVHSLVVSVRISGLYRTNSNV